MTPTTPSSLSRALPAHHPALPGTAGLRAASRRLGAQTLLANRSAAAAFLCYHSVAGDGPPFLSLPPELFERQMALLARAGWRSGDSARLRELVAGRRPSAPLAFLTFDDGFADNHATAMPIMLEHGLTPIVFVLPPRVDVAGPLDWPEVQERHRAHPGVMRSMGWDALDEMAEAGAEIGSHGLSHADLSSLGPEPLREELVDARRILLERYGRCELLAYPFGYWSREVAAAAADAGYSYAFSVPSRGQGYYGRHAIPRVPVDHRDDEARFALKLSTAGRRLLLSPVLPALRRARDLALGSH